MAVQAEIVELLEEILNSGRSAEEVCADRPELLEEIRLRLREVHKLDAVVER